MLENKEVELEMKKMRIDYWEKYGIIFSDSCLMDMVEVENEL